MKFSIWKMYLNFPWKYLINYVFFSLNFKIFFILFNKLSVEFVANRCKYVTLNFRHIYSLEHYINSKVSKLIINKITFLEIIQIIENDEFMY